MVEHSFGILQRKRHWFLNPLVEPERSDPGDLAASTLRLRYRRSLSVSWPLPGLFTRSVSVMWSAISSQCSHAGRLCKHAYLAESDSCPKFEALSRWPPDVRPPRAVRNTWPLCRRWLVAMRSNASTSVRHTDLFILILKFIISY